MAHVSPLALIVAAMVAVTGVGMVGTEWYQRLLAFDANSPAIVQCIRCGSDAFAAPSDTYECPKCNHVMR